jgi:hypothetical protein
MKRMVKNMNSVVEIQSLRKLTHDLDFGLGAVGATISDLVDVQILLDQLVVKMDDSVYRGEERYYYREHHRLLKVYANLIRYLMNDISGEYERIDKVHSTLFEKVHEAYPENKEKNQSAANELALQ